MLPCAMFNRITKNRDEQHQNTHMCSTWNESVVDVQRHNRANCKGGRKIVTRSRRAVGWFCRRRMGTEMRRCREAAKERNEHGPITLQRGWLIWSANIWLVTFTGSCTSSSINEHYGVEINTEMWTEFIHIRGRHYSRMRKSWDNRERIRERWTGTRREGTGEKYLDRSANFRKFRGYVTRLNWSRVLENIHEAIFRRPRSFKILSLCSITEPIAEMHPFFSPRSTILYAPRSSVTGSDHESLRKSTRSV